MSCNTDVGMVKSTSTNSYKDYFYDTYEEDSLHTSLMDEINSASSIDTLKQGIVHSKKLICECATVLTSMKMEVKTLLCNARNMSSEDCDRTGYLKIAGEKLLRYRCEMSKLIKMMNEEKYRDSFD
jgi:hypothetical protein